MPWNLAARTKTRLLGRRSKMTDHDSQAATAPKLRSYPIRAQNARRLDAGQTGLSKPAELNTGESADCANFHEPPLCSRAACGTGLRRVIAVSGPHHDELASALDRRVVSAFSGPAQRARTAPAAFADAR